MRVTMVRLWEASIKVPDGPVMFDFLVRRLTELVGAAAEPAPAPPAGSLPR